MKKDLGVRDILLFLILVMLVINAILNLPVRKVEADTFELDNCITSDPTDKPRAYLHVIPHNL